MSGWEVCRTIKKINPHLPVGMITGWGAGIDQPQMEENRLDFVISKPFDSEEVLNQIAEKVSSK
jgi:CheY-like chemotaxis protein